MRLSKVIRFFFPALAALISCNESPTNTEQDKPGIVPDITIQSNARKFWFRDSLLEDMIYPSTVHCTPGQPCAIIFGPKGFDYTCTTFPDTFWGIIEYDLFPSETLFCHSDSAWVLHDTTIYSMKRYLGEQSNALCSESAKAYTQIGMCYQFSTGETSVRLRNSCFDTTFTGTFCLPKMPLDSQNGVWFETIDTFFCPAYVINGYDDYMTRQDIKSWTQGN